MDEVSINVEIAEKIMGWEIVDRDLKLYRPKNQEQGNLLPVPDFVISPQAQRLLEDKMQELGYTLATEDNPEDWERGAGKMFMARFSMRGQTFESTEADRNLAVCRAALMTTGTRVQPQMPKGD